MCPDEQNHSKKLKISVDFADEAVALGARAELVGLDEAYHGERHRLHLVIGSDVPNDKSRISQPRNHLLAFRVPSKLSK